MQGNGSRPITAPLAGSAWEARPVRLERGWQLPSPVSVTRPVLPSLPLHPVHSRRTHFTEENVEAESAQRLACRPSPQRGAEGSGTWAALKLTGWGLHPILQKRKLGFRRLPGDTGLSAHKQFWFRPEASGMFCGQLDAPSLASAPPSSHLQAVRDSHAPSASALRGSGPALTPFLSPWQVLGAGERWRRRRRRRARMWHLTPPGSF